MFPAFINFALLAGAAAIAAPILIHLLLRRKSQRMRFSTIQFFLKQDEQSMRRRKLRNLILLSARVLLFLLLVLAFARPFLPNQPGGANAANRQQLVILLDTSASMQANGPAGSQWTRAVAFAREELRKLNPDDRAALVSSSTRAELISEFAPPATVLKKLEELRPTFGAARLDDGLRQAARVLATANPKLKTDLCIISDLQRSGCDNLAEVPLPRELAIRIVDLGERFIPNLAAHSLQLEADNESGPRVTLTSFSDEDSANIPYALKIDGKEIFSGTVALDAGAATNIPLAIPALRPGWHSAEFHLSARDSLSTDDAAYATLYVPPPIHGIVVETRETQQIFREETYFVATALNPSREDQPSASRFSYEKTAFHSLTEALKSRPGRPKAEFVVLPALKELPDAAVQALDLFVRGGGGLMLFLGDGASAIAYRKLGGLLPATFTRTEVSPNTETGWRIGNYNKTHPIFAVFKEPNSGNLSLHAFARRFGLTALPRSNIEAEFEDGAPLIITREHGEGRVVLVNTSADVAWTDWPKHKTFVPWLHATALFLARRDQIHEREAIPQFVSDSELELDLASATGNLAGIAAEKHSLQLSRPDGTQIALETDPDGVVRQLLLETPGIYLLNDAAGVELRRFAANLPFTESDLLTLAPADADQQLVRDTGTEPTILTAGLFGDSSRGKELWRVLLMAALGLLLLEPILANRMLT